MLFSSTIFLFYFLPILIGLYFVAPKILKNTLLLIASLLFYAWGEGIYVVLMLASIVLNYLFGIWLSKPNPKKWVLFIGVSANLSILLVYKYANFLVANFNQLLNYADLPLLLLKPISLPLGISFFTFQAISYLIDIHRKEIAVERNPIHLGLYIAMFPQLIAGPIVRFKTVLADIKSRVVSAELFLSGVNRFIIGLAKKMLIANPLGAVVDIIFELPPESVPTHVAWFGIACYALQIFFDFSGYSDMAIGLGRMFGFRFLENFNYPYIARSLQDFWRRWHISLSSWFRDYLYIPMGGNRKSPLRTYLNLSVVFLLCGLWHGASWNFVVWGLFHGSLLILERQGLENLLRRLWLPLQHAYLVFIILVSWVFFRSSDLSAAKDYLTRMFTMEFGALPFEVIDAMNVQVYLALIVGLILCCQMRSINTYCRTNFPRISSSIYIPMIAGLFYLSATQLAVSTHNPFIYFRF